MEMDIRFDTFYRYSELTEKLFAIVHANTDLFRIESIGKSYEGRDIWCVTATNFKTGPAEEKPAVWIDSNIHATEVSASVAALYFLHKLLREYGINPDITRCLDSRAFYIIPRLNPDGAEAFLSDPPRYLRSSTRPYPYDEEPIEGLKRQDLDGDGRVLTMRIKDPNGHWKLSAEDPRLMVLRDPAESGGQYYRLLPEGLLENWDGVTMKLMPNKEQLDLNRNFPANWRQEYQQHGAGPYPTSEPEVRAMTQFVSSHPNIVSGIEFHTWSGVLLRPYGTKSDDEMPAEDLWTYKTMGKKGTEITGYPSVSVYHDFRYHPREVITGVSDDWLYDHRGIFGWTVEIWSPQNQAGIREYKFIDWYLEHPLEDDLKMLKWNDEALEGKGYVDWYEFDHPQLGRIELGGWDALYCFRNPPPQFLEKEVSKFPDWLIWNALVTPKLELHSAELVSLGKGAYRLRVVVHNTGWMSTNVSQMALERKVVRGVVAEIVLPEGAQLSSGKMREEFGQLEGWNGKDKTAYAYMADPTDDRLKVEWVLTGKPGQCVKATIRHERAGTVRWEGKLP